MPRLILWFVVLATLAIGAPYAAMVLNIVQGRWSADGIERDGTVTHMVFDRDQPRPSWLPDLPGAGIAEATHVTNARQGRDYWNFELTTHRSMPEIRDFYRARLSGEGFTVVDRRAGTLNARAADYLGIADTLEATRKESGDLLGITISTPQGLLGARSVQIGWWRKPVVRGSKA